jgi:hypothetical protein
MRKLLMMTLLLSATALQAQNKSLTLAGSVQGGLLEGEAGSALQFGFTGGIKTKTWTTGIGAGIDYYRVRSLPLYLNMEKRLFNRIQTPFAYVNGGYHFTWRSSQNRMAWEWWPGNAETKGGLYYAAGLGYQLPVLTKTALFFAAGYSFKQFTEERMGTVNCIMWPCPEISEKFTHRLRRLSVTTGLRF